MDKKYELAKQQGLNWRALLLEDAQSELKILIRDSVLKNETFGVTNQKVTKKVEEVIKELESGQLKEKARQTLYSFGIRVYTYFKNTFGGLSLLEIYAFYKISQNKGTTSDLQIVRDKFNENVSSAYNRALPLDLYAKDYMKLVEDRINYLASIEAKEDYTSRVTLRNVAEIQIRQERHEQELQEMIDNGEDLIWIVPHANCSERCQKWQGKLYSISGQSGTIDGIRYEPLSNATDIYETTKTGKVYKNGCLSGFNCRHQIEPYRVGNKPTEIPARVIDKEREINAKQRYFERGVRIWREKALLFKGLNNDAYKYAKAKATEWNDRYIAFSKQNDVAYYPSRTEII